jgi:hypothetical protein
MQNVYLCLKVQSREQSVLYGYGQELRSHAWLMGGEDKSEKKKPIDRSMTSQRFQF